MTTAPGALLTLDAAAREAFPMGGVTADTLKRKARAGSLRVYRPGKAYMTTLADVAEMNQQCLVDPKDRTCGSVPHVKVAPPPGSSSTVHASAALDSALAQLPETKKKR